MRRAGGQLHNPDERSTSGRGCGLARQPLTTAATKSVDRAASHGRPGSSSGTQASYVGHELHRAAHDTGPANQGCAEVDRHDIDAALAQARSQRRPARGRRRCCHRRRTARDARRSPTSPPPPSGRSRRRSRTVGMSCPSRPSSTISVVGGAVTGTVSTAAGDRPARTRGRLPAEAVAEPGEERPRPGCARWPGRPDGGVAVARLGVGPHRVGRDPPRPAGEVDGGDQAWAVDRPRARASAPRAITGRCRRATTVRLRTTSVGASAAGAGGAPVAVRASCSPVAFEISVMVQAIVADASASA